MTDISTEFNGYDEVDMTKFLTPRQIRRLSKKRRKEYNRQLNGTKQIAEESSAYFKPIKTLKGKNKKQNDLIHALDKFNQVICFGPAGTGKTYVIAAKAAQMYLKGEIKQIVVTRANVATGKSLGFFPGTVEEKMMVWVLPVIQVLKQYLGESIFEIALKRGDIVLQPLETIRGMSFSESFVIVDEAQNIEINEVKALLTRIGENSKIVLNGDITQKDLKTDSGLEFVVNSINNNQNLANMTYTCEFGIADIVRSEICKQWVIHFDSYERGDFNSW